MKNIHLGLTFLYLFCILANVSYGVPDQIHVPGNKAWTKTGKILKTGMNIEIIATGQISPNGTVKCGPNGVSNRPDWQATYCVIKTSNHACLIGRIGENGKPFFVGVNLKIIAETSGELFLGINDTDLGNNSGDFIVSINITQNDLSDLNLLGKIKILGNIKWTRTGYKVKEGESIEINSEGEISPNGTIKCNPDGVPNRPDWQAKYCVINTSNHACLIGKIGENGKPFFVGKSITLNAVSQGEIFLGINDTDIGNNSGFFMAKISNGLLR